MNLQMLNKLHGLKDAKLHPGPTGTAFEALRKESGIVLSSDHSDLLKESNGVEAYAGYVRLFGIDTADSVDAIWWNRDEIWKFAWGSRCHQYWCFAETAWGDQYAYFYETLRSKGNSEIYFLDAFSMRPEVVASSFADFFEKEFLRLASRPYDAMTPYVRQKLGPLEVSSHLVYIPSLLLGGTEDIDHVQKLSARSAMICNGDIALQIEGGPADRKVMGLQPYEDELHRARLRLLWA